MWIPVQHCSELSITWYVAPDMSPCKVVHENIPMNIWIIGIINTQNTMLLNSLKSLTGSVK